MLLNKYKVELSENVMVSVIEWSENNYEVAVLTKWYSMDNWELSDDEGMNDVWKCTSQMEVYGIVNNLIKPYYEI